MFRIDPSSHVPIYVQIERCVRDDIARGRLQPGDPLPSIRAVADSLEISPNTVIQAYRALVTERVAMVQRGKGTFVADPSQFRPAQRSRLEEALVRETLEKAARLGLAPKDLIELLRRHLPPEETGDQDAG